MTRYLTCAPPPEPLPRPPEALLCLPEPQLTIFMPREGAGVALRSQVRHVVTYRDPPEGTVLYTVFTKKCQNGPKRGCYPLFLTEIFIAPPT